MADQTKHFQTEEVRQAMADPNLPRAIRDMVTLPQEILDMILISMPLDQLFGIAVYSIPTFDQALRNLAERKKSTIGRIFPTERTKYEAMKEIYQLWVDLDPIVELPGSSWAAPIDYKIKRSKDMLERLKSQVYMCNTPEHLYSVFYDEIIQKMDIEVRISSEEGKGLPHFSYRPPGDIIPGGVKIIERCKSRWQFVKKAHHDRITKKLTQVKRLEALISEYPGMLTSATRGDQKSMKESHILNSLRSVDKRIRREATGKCSRPCKYLFPIAALPFIPYNVHLRKFCQTLESCPMRTLVAPPSTQPSHDISVASTTPDKPPSGHHAYPEDILRRLHNVIQHLDYYILDERVKAHNLPRLMRTQGTKYSAEPFDSALPVFVAAPLKWESTRHWPKDETNPTMEVSLHGGSFHSLGGDNYRGYWPLPTKDLDWLEDFLEVSRYLQSLDGVDWIPNDRDEEEDFEAVLQARQEKRENRINEKEKKAKRRREEAKKLEKLKEDRRIANEKAFEAMRNIHGMS